MFRELSKIILKTYAMPEIMLMVRISSWNFMRVQIWAWNSDKKYDFCIKKILSECFGELTKCWWNNPLVFLKVIGGILNLLKPGYIYRTGLLLVLVMACCLLPPNHYLAQCLLITYQLISPRTKWPPFYRRHFRQMHFREWKVLHFD